jgi:hypothetical protein
MPMSPTTFFAGVSGLIRIGQAARLSYRQHLRRDDIQLLPPGAFPPTREELEAVAIYEAWELERDKCGPGGPFQSLFLESTGAYRLNPGAGRRAYEAVIDAYFERHPFARSITLELEGGHKRVMPCDIVLAHKEWLDPAQRSPWAKLGLEIADVALGFVALQPDALGLDRRATEIVGAIAPNLSALLREDGDAAEQGLGSRLVHAFFEASLETVAERPDLFVSEERWQPFVTGIAVPFKDYIKANPGREFLAHDRLRALLRGPIAHSLLTSLSVEADSFLTGRFADDRALGAVARCVLGAVATSPRDGFDLRRVFTEEGAALIFQSALEVAERQPDLFIKGIGLESATGQQFLRQVAGTLKNKPWPYGIDSGLAPQIASISIGVAGDYVAARLRAGSDDTLWAAAGTDVAEGIIGQIVQGFQDGVAGKRDAFKRVFQLDQASDVLRIIATHVAQNPDMLVGGNANSEVAKIARGVASLIAHDTAGRLNGEDWRTIVATTVQLAAANPGALFSIENTDRPENEVAVALIGCVLSCAGASLTERRAQGGILFGQTLRQAITATLSAAASNLFGPPDFEIDGIGGTGTTRFARHVAALDAFLRDLLVKANGENRALRMSASEFLYVYRHFIAHVLSEGPDADVSEERIFELLHSLESRNPEGEVVG